MVTAEEERFKDLVRDLRGLYKEITTEDLDRARVVGWGLPIKDDYAS